MKTYFSKGVRWRVTSALMLILAIFIIHSCKKDNVKTSKQETVKTDQELIADAQSYFNKEVTIPQNGIAVNGAGNNKTFRELLGKNATFEDAYIQQEPVGKIVVIPLKFSKEMYLDRTAGYLRLSDVSNLIIYTDTLKKKHAEVVTRIPDDTYLADTTRNKLFSGIVTVEDWQGNYIKGMQYSKGKIVKMLGAPETQNTRMAVNGVKKSNDVVCTTTDYYMVYTDASAIKTTVNSTHYTYQYSETVCAIVWDDSGGGNIDYSGVGGGGLNNGCPVITGPITPDPWQNSLKHVINAYGGDAPVNQPCNTVTTTVPADAVQDIIDEVTNPCLKSIIDQLANKSDLRNSVTNMLRSNFGILNTINITFTESSLTGNHANDDAFTDGDQLNQLVVTYNSPQLEKASEEYLAETTMHEIFHAIMDIYPDLRGNMSQHLYMAQNYINAEVTALRQMFPMMSVDDAQCLALGGVRRTTA